MKQSRETDEMKTMLIQIKVVTAQDLKLLKITQYETYDEIIRRLLEKKE